MDQQKGYPRESYEDENDGCIHRRILNDLKKEERKGKNLKTKFCGTSKPLFRLRG
jgi:hypothetical protein